MVSVAVWSFVVLSTVVVGFQLAVAAGAPWGHLTQGGRHTGTLPPSGRAMAAVSAIIVAALALVLLARAGSLNVGWVEPARPWVWVVVGVSALTVLANAASKSRLERALWLPIGLLLLAGSIVVALS